ncbi:MAG: phosphotransferase [Alphaproteobacteria bacterium]|nr:phosphotransferase [Alphaproteobacteria bacterium]
MAEQMTDRDARITALLADAGWGAAARDPLPGDASFRHYVRLRGGPRPALLMDAPPPQEDVRPYVRVARHLHGLGFSPPEIFAEDVEAGLLVIEDFGDETYTRRLAAGGDEAEMYALATDVLIALHRNEAAGAIDLPAYDEARFFEEAALLVDWYLPAMTGGPTDPALREEYRAIWAGLLLLADAVPDTLTLRDFHVDNLMWRARETGLARCGLLDFQDAVIGPVAYDLVSLLEDARRDVPEPLIDAMTERYLDAFPGLDRADFSAAAAALSAQRNCKIIGIFTRLCVRDGKPVYLEHIPRVWRWLERDLAHPALAPMKTWLDRVIPAGERRIPPVRPAA